MISKKSVIIALIAVLLLGGVYFFVTRDEKPPVEEGKTETVQKNDGETIFETDKNSITNLFISNNSGEYEFYADGTVWYVRGGEHLLYNQPLIFSTVLDYVTVTPSIAVEENAEDISVYGLENSKTRVNVKTSDGKDATFVLGDETKGGNGYYFMMEGDSSVYTISKAFGTNMLKALEDYRDTGLFELTVDEITEVTYTVFGTGEVTVKKLDEQKDMMTSWEMTKPYKIGVYDEKFITAVLTPLTQVSVSQFLSDDPTEEQLKSSGFDNPSFTFSVKTKDNEYKVILGNKYDSYYAAKREDLPSVYLVSESALTFLFADTFDYINKYEYLPHRDDVTEISCNIDGKNHRFEITDPEDKEKISVILNQNSIPVDEYTKVYQQLFGVEIVGHVTAQPENKDDVTFSYTVKNAEGKIDEISYVKMNGKFSYQFVNGECSFYVYNDDVDASLKAVAELSKLSENPENFKEEEQKEGETEPEGFNWLAMIAVIVILGLISIFPISILRDSKKKKKE